MKQYIHLQHSNTLYGAKKPCIAGLFYTIIFQWVNLIRIPRGFYIKNHLLLKTSFNLYFQVLHEPEGNERYLTTMWHELGHGY